MIGIRRLNLDSSWQITWANQSILMDPWLLGVEIDYASFFNKQWHVTPAVNISSLDHYDAILISQHFSDHCHEETLLKLQNRPILCTQKAAKRIKKTISDANTLNIPTIREKEWLKLGLLEIGLLPAPSKMSASFSGIVIRHMNKLLVYCPHGYTLTKADLKILQPYHTTLLITSFSTFKLPFYLGGFVNPGLKKAKALVKQLNPKHIIATHDEEKHASGLVKKMAKVYYPSKEELSRHFPNLFIDLNYTNKILEITV